MPSELASSTLNETNFSDNLMEKVRINLIYRLLVKLGRFRVNNANSVRVQTVEKRVKERKAARIKYNRYRYKRFDGI